jgi:16S rRNA (guanine527-N7)-methyltransferase
LAGLDQLLAEGLSALAIPSTAAQRDQLLALLALLEKWNRVYNLTSIGNPRDRVALHLLDSLAVLPYLRGSRVLDVGTGAGFPGIPLAVFKPNSEFVLVDSNSKKTRFVQQAVIELGLANVRVEQTRIEAFEAGEGFDVITSRAFASLVDFLAGTRRLLKPGGIILAQKGRLEDDELGRLRGVTTELIRLDIPGVDAERHLVAITIVN